MLSSFSIFDTAAILSPAIQFLINRERHYNPRVADALDKMEAMVGFLFKSAFMFINVLNDSLTMSFNKLSPERFLYCIPKKGLHGQRWLVDSTTGDETRKHWRGQVSQIINTIFVEKKKEAPVSQMFKQLL